MPKYLLMVYFNGAQERLAELPENDRAAMVEEFRAFFQRPEIRDGNQLQPASTASTVLDVAGAIVREPGPFASAPGESLGGYYLVEAADADAAAALAAGIPTVRLGSVVEVRPVIER